MKRTAMKASRLKGVPDDVKDLLKGRNHGWCEIGVKCAGQSLGVDPAHREGKGSGGTGKEWSNQASNLLWACRSCHDEIDNGAPRDAERYGFKVRSGVARPWEIPVKHYEHGWVLLDDEGSHRPAPSGAYKGGLLIPVVACTAWDLMVQGGAFIDAMARHKHLQCPGWSPPREGLFTCGCGSAPFYVLVA